MKNPGRKPLKVDPKTKNKVITLRIDGELFNSIVDACAVHERAINSLLIGYIETGLGIDLKRTNNIIKTLKKQNEDNNPAHQVTPPTPSQEKAALAGTTKD